MQTLGHINETFYSVTARSAPAPAWEESMRCELDPNRCAVNGMWEP